MAGAAMPTIIQGGSQNPHSSISRPIPLPLPLPSMNALRSGLRHSPAAAAAAAVARLWGFFSPPFHPLALRRCRRAPPVDCLPAKSRARARARVLKAEPKDQWLSSLSLPLPNNDRSGGGDGETEASSGWVVGVDPDLTGALALLKPDGSARVFDNPHLHVLVAKNLRKRLDARTIAQLLRGFGAPPGTPAYVEQSIPFPTDGKQGWWSGGFAYGLWIGILVASGFSVVPVASKTWKAYFGLSRGESTKDDSRKAASVLFPDKAILLKRKKDHGRAEALLIAAYGKGLALPSEKLN